MSRTLLILFLFGAVSFVRANDNAPGWLREIATRNTPTYPAKVPAVALLRETSITVQENGRIIRSVRNAVKVLTREGRDEAHGDLVYSAATGKIRDARAWIISPSGDVLPISKTGVLDHPYAVGNPYEDLRVRELDARDKVDPGSVFGYELVSEDVPAFPQVEWSFQERAPALVSRFNLTLPSGWRMEGKLFNHSPIDPSVQGAAYSWELRDLPYVEREPASPEFSSLVPRLGVTYFPPSGAKSFPASAFTSWREVSRWVSNISDNQAEPNDAIKAKALTVAANAQTELQRMQALGLYVQRIRYIAMQTGLNRGGYRPRAASETFIKEYGDSKDKATLMRAMLKAIGIPSYLVLINNTDRTYVQNNWPSPEQFNHMIVALSVSGDLSVPSMLNHPILGRLLFFDPTNAVTPVGDLPRSQQGSLALIAAGDKGDIVRMPMTPPGFNLVERQIRGVLDESGALHASVRTIAHGQAAAADRAMRNSNPDEQFLHIIQQWVTRGSPGATASKIELHDNLQQGIFLLDVELDAPLYAQRKGSGLLVFKPTIVNRREAVFLTDPKRMNPVMLEASAWREVVRLKLPSGYKVDELPDPAKLDTPFGQYVASFEAQHGELVFTRKWDLRPTLVPIAQYGAIREFYERILAIEQSPVVLIRE
jgi:hypothetical protein